MAFCFSVGDGMKIALNIWRQALVDGIDCRGVQNFWLREENDGSFYLQPIDDLAAARRTESELAKYREDLRREE